MSTITFEDIGWLTEGLDPKTRNLVGQVCEDINQADQEIRGLLSFVTDAAARIETALNEAQSLSQVGEFQGTPARIDMAVAARAYAWKQLTRLLGRQPVEDLIGRLKTPE